VGQVGIAVITVVAANRKEKKKTSFHWLFLVRGALGMGFFVLNSNADKIINLF